MNDKANDLNRIVSGTLEAKCVTVRGDNLYLGTSQGEMWVSNLPSLERKVSDLEMGISALTQEVNSLQDKIDQKVDKGGVITSINLSTEDVRIKGSKLIVNGETIKTQVTP